MMSNDSDSDSDLPDLSFSNMPSINPTTTRKSIQDLLRDTIVLSADHEKEHAEENALAIIECSQNSSSPEQEEERNSPTSPSDVVVEEKVFCIQNNFVYFYSPDITLQNCGYTSNLIDITKFEELLISSKPVKLEHVYSTVLSVFNCEKNLKTCFNLIKPFIYYLLKVLSIHENEDTVQACEHYLRTFLALHPEVEFEKEELFIIIFNYGVEIEKWEDLLDISTRIKKPSKSFNYSNRIPSNWFYNFESVLCIIQELIIHSCVKNEDLSSIVEYLLLASIDTNLKNNHSLCYELKKCIAEALEAISEEEWSNSFSGLSTFFMTVQKSSISNKWKNIYEMIKIIPTSTVRSCTLQKRISWTLLKLCFGNSIDEEIFLHGKEYALEDVQNILESIEVEYIPVIVKLIDLAISHLNISKQEEYENLCSSLRHCEHDLKLLNSYKEMQHIARIYYRTTLLMPNQGYKIDIKQEPNHDYECLTNTAENFKMSPFQIKSEPNVSPQKNITNTLPTSLELQTKQIEIFGVSSVQIKSEPNTSPFKSNCDVLSTSLKSSKQSDLNAFYDYKRTDDSLKNQPVLQNNFPKNSISSCKKDLSKVFSDLNLSILNPSDSITNNLQIFPPYSNVSDNITPDLIIEDESVPIILNDETVSEASTTIMPDNSAVPEEIGQSSIVESKILDKKFPDVIIKTEPTATIIDNVTIDYSDSPTDVPYCFISNKKTQEPDNVEPKLSDQKLTVDNREEVSGSSFDMNLFSSHIHPAEPADCLKSPSNINNVIKSISSTLKKVLEHKVQDQLGDADLVNNAYSKIRLGQSTLEKSLLNPDYVSNEINPFEITGNQDETTDFIKSGNVKNSDETSPSTPNTILTEQFENKLINTENTIDINQIVSSSVIKSVMPVLPKERISSSDVSSNSGHFSSNPSIILESNDKDCHKKSSEEIKMNPALAYKPEFLKMREKIKNNFKTKVKFSAKDSSSHPYGSISGNKEGKLVNNKSIVVNNDEYSNIKSIPNYKDGKIINFEPLIENRDENLINVESVPGKKEEKLTPVPSNKFQAKVTQCVTIKTPPNCTSPTDLPSKKEDNNIVISSDIHLVLTASIQSSPDLEGGNDIDKSRVSMTTSIQTSPDLGCYSVEKEESLLIDSAQNTSKSSSITPLSNKNYQNFAVNIQTSSDSGGSAKNENSTFTKSVQNTPKPLLNIPSTDKNQNEMPSFESSEILIIREKKKNETVMKQSKKCDFIEIIESSESEERDNDIEILSIKSVKRCRELNDNFSVKRKKIDNRSAPSSSSSKPGNQSQLPSSSALSPKKLKQSALNFSSSDSNEAKNYSSNIPSLFKFGLSEKNFKKSKKTNSASQACKDKDIILDIASCSSDDEVQILSEKDEVILLD